MIISNKKYFNTYVYRICGEYLPASEIGFAEDCRNFFRLRSVFRGTTVCILFLPVVIVGDTIQLASIT